ncbi:hypothetical protein CMI47_02860 [Candidatus Pacearchaeota archaeon]|nr:hypothetical protein [Candidatus Pacearchaeota archaeon]|tara:strand:+ start:78 stop:494 length:417 start_codon:yes stop_codon:yes gene_type:complete
MSERKPEDYERALRAVLAITMDTLRGQSPFNDTPSWLHDAAAPLDPELRVQVEDIPVDGDPCPDCGRPVYYIGDDGPPSHKCSTAPISVSEAYEGPVEDGDPCSDCARPVWYCNDEEQWFHFDPAHQCFLARGKAKYP